jgi:hypothetical protein
MKQLYLYLFILSLLVSVTSIGQSVTPVTAFNSAGGTYFKAGAYYRFEWSLGEAALVNTICPSDSSLFITHGVLQPITEKASLSPYIIFFARGEYFIFPNPTQGRFEVNFMVRQSGRLELQLTDLTGRVIRRRALRYPGWGHIEHYDLSSYPNGTYFVIATLTPDTPRPGDGKLTIRHSGFKIIKLK